MGKMFDSLAGDNTSLEEMILVENVMPARVYFKDSLFWYCHTLSKRGSTVVKRFLQSNFLGPSLNVDVPSQF
jgi:hypothetical protein